MGKALEKIGIGAAIIGAAFLTGGASLAPTATALAGGGFAFSTALSTTLLGGLALAAGGTIALGGVEGALAKKPKASLAQIDRLNASLVPTAPRADVFGRTAMATDIRYVEPSGDDQEYIDYIIAVAAHRVNAIQELWFEDLVAWTLDGGVTGNYQGYLTVDLRLEGAAANAVIINDGSKWGAGRRLTGCAYLHLRIKRTGKNKKAESPFSGGLPSRMTIVGEGRPFYDPRYDDTVPGGTGPMRVNDQSTWAFAYDGRQQGYNPALAILNRLLGWRINGKLSVGMGVPARRIDMPSFLVAANLCDEPVIKADGTIQTRFLTAGVFTEADDPTGVLGNLTACCNGRLRDAGGKLTFAVMHNDLAAAALDDGLGDDDVDSPYTWTPDGNLEQSYNVVRGQYTDPSAASLYQLNDYGEIRAFDFADGIDRVLTLDLPQIQDVAMAQRLAKQALQRKQYQRSFSATFKSSAWRYKVGDVLPFTFGPLSFQRRLFRVSEMTETMDGSCPMVLTEENPVIYSWDKEDTAAVQASEPIVYDSRNNPLLLGIAQAGTTADWPTIGGVGKPADNATNSADPASPFGPDGQTVGQTVRKLSDIVVDVADLQATYGDTASSAASAEVARQQALLSQQARDGAATAQIAAETALDATRLAQDGAEASAATSTSAAETAAAARDAAQAAVDTGVGTINASLAVAHQAATDASAATAAAQAARDLAAQRAADAAASSTSAGGFAQTATGSAATAIQASTASGQSAANAAAAEESASTQAGNASIFAARAETAEANAAGSANSATAAAGVSAASVSAAQLAVAAAFPSDVVNLPSAFTVATPFAAPAATIPLAADGTNYVDPGLTNGPGRVFTVAVNLAGRQLLQLVAGRTLRVTAGVESAFAAQRRRVAGLLLFDATGAYLSGYEVAVNMWGGATGVPLISTGDVATDVVIAFEPRAAQVRPYFLADTAAGELWIARYLRFADVTSEVGAAGSAAAAALYSATAATKSTEAAQSASASTAASVSAATSEGNASTYQRQAAQSSQDASGSAQVATAAQGLATQARDQAGQYAQSSSASANVATAKANDAGAQATVAAAAALSASTDSGNALIYQQQAAQSASGAAGSNQSAIAASALATSARDQAGQYADASNSSAQTASAKADQAGQSAAASNASALQAGTASGTATAAAGQAVTSAADALGASQSAASSAGVAASLASDAQRTVAAAFPAGLYDGRSFTLDYTVAPATARPLTDYAAGSYPIANFGGESGWVFPASVTVATLAWQPLVPGRSYRATARIGVNAVAASNVFYGFLVYNSARTLIGSWSISAPSVPPAGPKPFVFSAAAADIIAALPAAATIRGYSQFAVGTGADAVVIVASIKFEDVTSELLAAGSASAASSSAALASAKSDAAGVSADAATAASNTATTAAGSADTYSRQSAASATAAAGSSQIASDASGVAVQARDQAGQSAAASNASAQSAAARSDAAGVSAATSSQQAGVATTAAGNASTSAQQAAISSQTSQGSANSATASAEVTASNVTATELALAAAFPASPYDGKGFTLDFTSPPAAARSIADYPAGSYPIDAYIGNESGRVFGSATTIATLAWQPLLAGRTYEIAARLGVQGGPATSVAYGFLVFDGTGLLGPWATGLSSLAGAAPTTYDRLGVADEIKASYPTATTIRGYAQFVPAAGGLVVLTALAFSDATDKQLAAGSAAAAATYAAAAGTRSDASAVSADASQSSATSAAIAAGSSAAYAAQAGAAQQSAAASSSSASTSSGVAAQAAHDAGAAAGASAAASTIAVSYADAAGQSATSASQARNDATTQAGNASASAGQSAGSAASAQASANQAASYLSLTASTSLATANANPTFSAWDANAEVATGWNNWGAPGYINHAAGLNGMPNSMQIHDVGSNNVGWYQTIDIGFGAYIIEAQIRLNGSANSVSTSGSGMLVLFNDATGTAISSAQINFYTDGDNSVPPFVGNGGDVGFGYIRSFSKFVQTPVDGAIRKANVYIMGNWEGFESPRVNKDLNVFRCSIRPATASEIAAQRADALSSATAASLTVTNQVVEQNNSALTSQISNLSSTVGGNSATLAVYAGTLATLDQRTQAYWGVVANAGDGTAFLQANVVGGAGEISMGADAFHLFNRTTGGFVDAMTLMGGDVVFSGKLRAASVDTDNLVDNSVTQSVAMRSASTYTGGSGTWQIFSYILNVVSPSTLFIIAGGKQGYNRTSGSIPWNLVLNVDGAQANYAGGASAYTDSPSVFAVIQNVSVGNHTIELTWIGDAVQTLAGVNMMIQCLKK